MKEGKSAIRRKIKKSTRLLLKTHRMFKFCHTLPEFLNLKAKGNEIAKQIEGLKKQL